MVRRRLLPTAIVGGVLVSGMAFGVGTAAADDAPLTCRFLNKTYEILDTTKVTRTDNGRCDRVAGPLLSLSDLAGAVRLYVPPTTVAAPASPSAAPAPGSSVPPAPSTSARPTTTPPPAAKPTAAVPVVPPAAVAPAAPVLAGGAVGAAPDAALLSSSYSPALLASGTYDPSLLLGAPGVTPMVGLASATDPASAVTTASQVQAMALQAPGGLGLPAVAGVVILAGLGGTAVRYRLRRAGAEVTGSS